MSGVEAIIGLASGSAGLATLLTQLFMGGLKLKAICEKAKAAPNTVARVLYDLGTIDRILRHLERHRHDDSNSSAVVDRCVASCRSSASRLDDLLAKLDKRLKQRRSVGAKFFAAIKDDELQELVADLENSKSLVSMAYDTLTAESLAVGQAKLDAISTQVQLSITAIARLDSQLTSRLQPLSLTCASEPIAQGETGGLSLHELAQARHEDIRNDRVHRSAALPRKKPPRSVFRLRLVVWTWHSRRAWDIAITAAQGDWHLRLNPFNIVSTDAPVFERCRAGDMQGMKKLVEAGQASYTDIENSRGHDLLMTAALAGEVHTYTFLLQEMPWRIDTPLPVFSLYILGFILDPDQRLLNDESGLETLYTSFTQLPSFSAEDFDRYQWHSIILLCPSVPMYGHLLREGISQFAGLSEPERLALLLQIGIPSRYGSPDELFQTVGLTLTDVEMAKLVTEDGFTILDLVGQTLGKIHALNVQSTIHDSWSLYAERMLKAGADPCSLTLSTKKGGNPITPLLAYASRSSNTFDSLRSYLQAWASLLHRAGLDLSDYGRREAEIWSQLSQDGRLLESLDIWSDRLHAYYANASLHVGPKAQDWTIVLSHALTTETYVLQQPPCAFPRNIHMPNVISWLPTTAELAEGQWQRQKAKSRQADRIALGVMARQYIEPFGELVESTQDDTSTILLLSERSAKRGIPPRSHSEPRSCTGQGPKWHLQRRSESHKWLPAYHLCPYDARWKFGCVDDDDKESYKHQIWSVNRPYDGNFHIRDCVKGIFSGRQFVQQSWRWRYNSFLGHISNCQDYAASTALGIPRLPRLPKEPEHIVT
ncbi:hypothetical protein LTR86_005710 [Recurvomyces mirabilis]|nr:hypothetical protein LTR86_005710 [Recurvomyces mirabilis]